MKGLFQCHACFQASVSQLVNDDSELTPEVLKALAESTQALSTPPGCDPDQPEVNLGETVVQTLQALTQGLPPTVPAKGRKKADGPLKHYFQVDDANRYGVKAAVILWHIRFWLAHNRDNHTPNTVHENRVWTYFTLEELCRQQPYFKVNEAHRILTKLVDQGIVIKSRFNKNGYVRTNWYSINEPEYQIRLKPLNGKKSLSVNKDFQATGNVQGIAKPQFCSSSTPPRVREGDTLASNSDTTGSRAMDGSAGVDQDGACGQVPAQAAVTEPAETLEAQRDAPEPIEVTEPTPGPEPEASSSAVDDPEADEEPEDSPDPVILPPEPDDPQQGGAPSGTGTPVAQKAPRPAHKTPSSRKSKKSRAARPQPRRKPTRREQAEKARKARAAQASVEKTTPASAPTAPLDNAVPPMTTPPAESQSAPVVLPMTAPPPAGSWYQRSDRLSWHPGQPDFDFERCLDWLWPHLLLAGLPLDRSDPMDALYVRLNLEQYFDTAYRPSAKQALRWVRNGQQQRLDSDRRGAKVGYERDHRSDAIASFLKAQVEAFESKARNVERPRTLAEKLNDRSWAVGLELGDGNEGDGYDCV